LLSVADPKPEEIRCPKCGLKQNAPPRALTRADRWKYGCAGCGFAIALLSLEILSETVHELKTWPEYFRQVKRGIKTCEIRNDDRGFKVGDILHLREWRPTPNYSYDGSGEYTGHFLYVQVTHIARGVFGLPRGVVVMSITTPEIWRKKFRGSVHRKVLTI
jgi:hypothetical protein